MKCNIYSRFLYPMFKSHDFIHLFGEKKRKKTLKTNDVRRIQTHRRKYHEQHAIFTFEIQKTTVKESIKISVKPQTIHLLGRIRRHQGITVWYGTVGESNGEADQLYTQPCLSC